MTVRYVELIRVSSQGQDARDTPEIQRRALDNLATSRPGVRVERMESVISGAASLEKRLDIQRLRALTDARAYDELRCYDVDRLTRAESVTDRLAIYALCQTAGAVIVDAGGRVIDPGDESGLGEIDYYLRTLFAARERKRIQARTSAGRAEAARKGRWIGGTSVPFGYAWTPGDKLTAGAWSVVPEHATIVRRIFADAAAGSPVREIAARLATEGFASPGGCPTWRNSTVSRILHHGVYQGDGQPVTIVGERHVLSLPALVDRDVWSRVQTALASREHRPIARYGTIEALIRGVGRCACGQPFDVTTWSTSRRSSARRVIYRCRSARKIYGPRCSSTITHRADLVDSAVWAALAAQLRDPDLLREAACAAGDDGDDGETWERQEASCKRERVKLERHEAEVLRLRARDLLSEKACEARLREIKGQRATLDRSAEVARQALARGKVLAGALESVEARVSVIKEGLDSADFATRRLLVQEVIPALAGYGVEISSDGRIVIQGALSLAAEPSSQQVRPARRAGLLHGRPADVIPLRVVTRYLRRAA